MTRETAVFLVSVLDSINLNVGAPGFDSDVANIQRAKTELAEILALSTEEAFAIVRQMADPTTNPKEEVTNV